MHNVLWHSEETFQPLIATAYWPSQESKVIGIKYRSTYLWITRQGRGRGVLAIIGKQGNADLVPIYGEHVRGGVGAYWLSQESKVIWIKYLSMINTLGEG